ncbi:cysteine desulfurase NifS [Candidatus Micrarchaeota archaeon]|nr:cysteine desulfurase NifS [Candidatus Micrarchaeota archaeon]
MKRIYLDNAATTPADKRVVKAMTPYFSEKYGNASSIHEDGRVAREAVERSRKTIADKLGVNSDEIFFTSSGTESDKLAIKGLAMAHPEKKHLITSSIEHHAVTHVMQFLETQGYRVTYLPVGKNGLVSPSDLKKAITSDTLLVSIMYANNEIGTIQPISELAKIAKQHGAFFHTDAVQALGKIPIDLTNVDLMSASAHKIYGPKGVGLLFKKRDVELVPLLHGGGHERGLRSSTENTPGIVGFAKAVELSFSSMKKDAKRESALRDRLMKGILTIPRSWVNGDRAKRLPGNAHFGFDYIEGESLLLMLDQKGIAASTGSACSTGDLKPSHVLLALGLPHEKCHGSLRLTIGRETSAKDIDYVIKYVKEVVAKLRELSPLGKGL